MSDPLTDKKAAESFLKEWAYSPHNSLYSPRSPVIRFHSPHKGCPQCQASTAHSMGVTTQFRQCSNRGKVTLADSSTWCGQHSPEAVAKRAAKQRERWEAEEAKSAARRAAWKAENDRRSAHDRYLDALHQIAEGHNDPRSLAMEVLGQLEQK